MTRKYYYYAFELSQRITALKEEVEQLNKLTRLMAGTLSTFGPYTAMHPEDVLTEFASLAKENGGFKEVQNGT